MLGYRGHFSTKSRAYSITLGSLRADQAAYQRERAVAAGLLPAADDAVIVDEIINSNPVERAKRAPRPGPRAGHRLDRGPAPGVPGHGPQHRLFAFFHVAAYTRS